MSPATGLIVCLLLPPVAAALLMLLSKSVPRHLTASPGNVPAAVPPAVPVAGAVLAVAFLLRIMTASPSGGGLPEDLTLNQFGLLDDQLARLWHLSCLLAGLLLLIGLYRQCTSDQVCGLLLATGATALAGCTSDLLALLICLELAAAGAALACPAWKEAGQTGGLEMGRETATVPVQTPRLAGIVPLLLAGLGALLLYGVCGTSRLEVAAEVMETAWLSPGPLEPAGEISVAAMAGAVLLLAGIGFRLPVFPSSGRCSPDGMLPSGPQFSGLWQSENEAGVQAVLVQSFFPRAAAVVALLRLAETVLPVLHEPAVVVLLVLCVLMALTGGLQLLKQRRPLECFCWLLMVQSALWLPGLMAVILLESPAAAGTVAEAAGSAQSLRFLLVLAFLAETCLVAGLLLSLQQWQKTSTPVGWQDDLAGLIRTRPVAATVLCLLLLAAAGCPPLMTFWTRLLLLQSVVSVHLESAGEVAPLLHPGLAAAGLAAAGGVACGLVATLRLLSTITLEPPRGSIAGSSSHVPLLVAALLTLGLLTGGLCPLLWWPGQ